MSKTYISNLNSLSALFDRLIVENIKLNHFQQQGNEEKIRQQNIMVEHLHSELVAFFTTTLQDGEYKHLTENRTFELKKKIGNFIEAVTELCICHTDITYCDGTKLREAKSDTPNMDLVLELEYRNRVNLEKRAAAKNTLDGLYEDILHTVKSG